MSVRLPRSRLLALPVAVLLATGCVAGPDPGPGIVHGDGAGAAETADSTLPGLAAPARDLNYRPCSDALTDRFGVDAPADTVLDCATIDVPLDPARPDGPTIEVGVTRAGTAQTPKDAVPLVLTAGTDLPGARLALNLGTAASPLLDRHPIVVVDRRGTGARDIDCLTTPQRTVIINDGASGSRDVAARTTALATAARAGADLCNDTLNPNQLKFANADAAADLEQLRIRWGVDRLALAGVGSGSAVVLSYLGAHPDRVGRLILDSPVGFNAAAPAAASARAAGVQNSLVTFATRCANVGCALGPDPVGTLNRVIGAGASGGLPGLSDTSVLTAITTAVALGDTEPEGLKALGEAIADADKGRAEALTALVERSEPLRNSDGLLLSRCNDLVGRPGTSDVPGLAQTWGENAPLTANTAALSLARCDGWGVADPAPAPTSFPVAPLVLLGQNDPINGLKAAEAIIPLLVTTGADRTTVSWDGLGYSVLSRSDCAAALVVEYLGTEPLSGPTERACPA